MDSIYKYNIVDTYKKIYTYKLANDGEYAQNKYRSRLVENTIW
jgi:hypothetical protein